MEDGAQLCDDQDISLEEIVGGQLLFIAKSWAEKSMQKETVKSSSEAGSQAGAAKCAVGVAKQAGCYAPVHAVTAANVEGKHSYIDL